MYSNNLILDEKEKIKIFQNDSSFYNITKSSIIKNAIQINLQPFEEFDILNLYLITKSYACNVIYITNNFFIIIKNENEKEFIAYSGNIVEIKNLTYYGFIDWFYLQLQHDWQYMNNTSIYSFLFVYSLDLFDKQLLNKLKPNYPWKNEILEKLAKLKNDEETYMDIINKQKNKIKELEKKIYDLENKKK